MPISTTCPQCKALFRLADALAGKKVKCQKCHSIFLVPASDGTTTTPGTTTAEAPPTAAVQAAQPWLAAPASPPVETVEAPVEAWSDEDEDEVAAEPKRSSRTRREDRTRGASAPPKGGLSTGMIVGILVLLGGGLLSCVVCGGGGLAIWLNSRDKKNDGIPVVHDDIPVVFDAKGVFRSDKVLTVFDRFEQVDPFFPQDKRHKVYFLQAEAGKSYQIDLMSPNMDSYLHVIDDQNNVVARDDDGGGGLNSHIFLRPTRIGRYRIIATSLTGHDVGNFTLVVNRFGDANPPPR